MSSKARSETSLATLCGGPWSCDYLHVSPGETHNLCE